VVRARYACAGSSVGSSGTSGCVVGGRCSAGAMITLWGRTQHCCREERGWSVRMAPLIAATMELRWGQRCHDRTTGAGRWAWWLFLLPPPPGQRPSGNARVLPPESSPARRAGVAVLTSDIRHRVGTGAQAANAISRCRGGKGFTGQRARYVPPAVLPPK